jgi:hypothetical protein
MTSPGWWRLRSSSLLRAPRLSRSASGIQGVLSSAEHVQCYHESGQFAGSLVQCEGNRSPAGHAQRRVHGRCKAAGHCRLHAPAPCRIRHLSAMRWINLRCVPAHVDPAADRNVTKAKDGHRSPGYVRDRPCASRTSTVTTVETFKANYSARYEYGVACLPKYTEALLSFWDCQAEHRNHLRTSNPIEGVFEDMAQAHGGNQLPSVNGFLRAHRHRACLRM